MLVSKLSEKSSDFTIDVVITTKQESFVRPALMYTLGHSQHVGKIIIETSAPLADARKSGALKCSTEWLAMFDDDVEIDDDWFETAHSQIKDGVVAVSSMYQEQEPNMQAYLNFFYSHKKNPEQIETANVNTLLIKRSVFEDYKPLGIFACEDNALYDHVVSKGKWVHFMGHAKHWMRFQGRLNVAIEAGRNTRRYKLTTKKQILKNTFYRFTIPFLIMPKTKSLKTIYYFWLWNFKFFWGYILG